MSSEPWTCASCGHLLHGRYCSSCGEERLDPGKLTFWHFLTRTLPAESLDLDGKIWRTLRWLLFRPGRLAIEYAAGRRRGYVTPLRVFLTAIVVYALSMPVGTNFTFNLGAGLEDIKVTMLPPRVPANRSVGASLFQIDRFGILERMFVRKIGSPESVNDDVRDRFNATLGALGTPLSFATVLVLALPLYLCFRGRRPLLLEHAVFTMHFFSFVLLTAPLLLLGFKLGRAGSFLVFALVMLAVTLWQFGYLAVGIRRFYLPDRTRLTAWPTAVLLAAALYVLNSIFMTAVQFFAAAVAIWRL